MTFAPVPDPRPDDTAWPAMSWPPDPAVPLRGATVQLTLVRPEDDAAELFDVLDSDAVWQHVAGRPRDPEHYRELLEAALDTGRLPWVLRLARPLAGLRAGAVVGTSSYLDVSVPDARLEIGHTTYTPAVWGGAVNPEAKLLLLQHAFQVLHAGRVQLKTDVRNVRSQQAIARLGARYEGTLRRYQRRSDGTVRDTILFSITAEEWPDVETGLRARLYTD